MRRGIVRMAAVGMLVAGASLGVAEEPPSTPLLKVGEVFSDDTNAQARVYDTKSPISDTVSSIPVSSIPISSISDTKAPTSETQSLIGNAPLETIHGIPKSQLLRFRGGLSYYDHPLIDSKTGGTYGLDGILPLSEVFGGYVAGKVNHVGSGSQYYASVGLYKTTDISGDSRLSRFGGAFFYDYFTDSRAGDLDLTAYRLYLGYAMSENWSLGIRYIEPGEDDIGPLFFLNNRGNAVGTFFISQSVAAYASGYVGDSLLTGAVGYRDDANTTFLEAAIRRPVASNLFAFVDTHYEERGDWVVVTGLEFRFGSCKSRSSCNCGCHRRSPWDDPTIAESFNWGESKIFGIEVDVEERPSNNSPPAMMGPM